jgi:O-antigen/teichoic acid export membrane protein
MSVISAKKADSRALQARVLSGSAVLVAGSAVVSAVNFGYNLAVARLLGPAAFGHASVVYTLLVIVSAITLSYQILAAKIVAQQTSLEARAQAYRGFHRSSWFCGLAVALAIVLFRNPITNYLKLPSPVLIVLLGVGAAFYVPLGSCRGYMQGVCDFRQLAWNTVLEGVLRLGGSLLLIFAGFGVTGVVAANAAAVAFAYIFAIPKLPAHSRSSPQLRMPAGEAIQAIVFFVGQIVIMNSDIIIVKHFFAPVVAGIYAAIALIGRMIFVFSRSVVNTMFPISAGANVHGRKDNRVLTTSLLLVAGIGAAASIALALIPEAVWKAFFGPGFVMVQSHTISYFLVLYAVTTTIYSFAVVIIAYEMSYRIANTGWIQLGFCVILIAGMYLFHSSLQQVILIQLVLMFPLLAFAAVPFILTMLGKSPDAASRAALIRELNVIRPASEDEVIAGFLQSDFHLPEFAKYRSSLGQLVTSPDIEDPVENALRRALLYVRHDALWRELPKDTKWFRVRLDELDLYNIRVFPRAQWRKLAQGNFCITEICESIAAGVGRDAVGEKFMAKIDSLRNAYQQRESLGAVLLIGQNESGPFTVIDGNHRLVAAILASPDALNRKLSLFCGISPQMNKCCWYDTNISTLFRYGTNLLRHAFYDPGSEISRLLRENLSA